MNNDTMTPEVERSKHDIPEELQKSLKGIVKLCEEEDIEIRKSMIRNWKKLEEFWHGVQFLFWSSSEQSWRSPVDFGWGDQSQDFEDVEEQFGSFSDKVVDIFRGHGEAIISALASQIPALRFSPDDADSIEDLQTARTYSKIADLIQKHNKAKLVFLKALFFLAVHGMVASYRYKDSDLAYGSYTVPVYDKETVESTRYECETCGYTENGEEREGNWNICPNCGTEEAGKEIKEKQEVPILVRNEQYPKTRVKLDIFGPLQFKVPYYARNQSECGYMILYGDQAKDTVTSIFPDLEKEIQGEGMENADRFSRSAYSSEFDAEYKQRHLITVKKCWLRPSVFYRESEEDKRKELQKRFPSGCVVTLLGKTNIFVSVEEESLDRRWEIGQAGLSTYIHSDPILRPLVEIQEMRNQLVNLIMETINHGIPSDFADPETINFDTYGRFEAVPGYIYKAKPRRPGDPLANSFYTQNRATLSREVALFLQQLDKDAQFSIGSFPSVYGGPSEGKSRTFSEYAASRQMALQRLSIAWTYIVDWWVRTISGSVELYKECVVEDERYTKFENGNYINVWIKQSEMNGKIGGVEAEASETFPVSQTQIKDLLLRLIELNNENINTALYNPENSKIIQDALALTELRIPGEDQRIKQSSEINELLKNGPISENQSTIPVEPLVDDHAIHMSILKSFMVSEIGMEEKRVNPEGYANLNAHMLEHQMVMQAQLMQAMMSQQGIGNRESVKSNEQSQQPVG
jgi:hypothetical protein